MKTLPHPDSTYSHQRRFVIMLTGMVLLAVARPTGAQEAINRVGDMVRNKTFSESYDSGDFHHFNTGSKLSVYTHGVGLTIEESNMWSWSLLNYELQWKYSGHYARFQAVLTTNVWLWENGGIAGGSWNVYTEYIKDTHIRSLSPLTLQAAWTTNHHPSSLHGPHITPDFADGFKGPVGTIKTTNDNGGITTESYTTTAGLYISGDPSSTNENFYRVRLSLEYSDHTPISVPYNITSYLGAVPDTNSAVYVWLTEGKEYTAKPVFKTANPPSFYSYSAEPERAQRMGTLVICTIAADGSWPGSRPDGILGRMNYPEDESPSDDQMIQDLLLNTSAADIITTALIPVIPFGYQVDASRGKLTNLTVDDRKWLTVLLLSRSTNSEPPSFLTYEALETFLDDTRFTYRLANELSIEAVAYAGTYGHNVPGQNVLRRQAKLGQTTIQFWDDVKVHMKHLFLPNFAVPLGKDFANICYRGFATLAVHNAAGAYHDQLIGGQKGTTYIVNTCSGHAGRLLRSVEAPILQQQAPDFYIKIFYRVPSHNPYTFEVDFMYSGYPSTVWPTMFEYDYNFEKARYERTQTRHQSATPFDGFLSIE